MKYPANSLSSFITRWSNGRPQPRVTPEIRYPWVSSSKSRPLAHVVKPLRLGVSRNRTMKLRGLFGVRVGINHSRSLSNIRCIVGERDIRFARLFTACHRRDAMPLPQFRGQRGAERSEKMPAPIPTPILPATMAQCAQHYTVQYHGCRR